MWSSNKAHRMQFNKYNSVARDNINMIQSYFYISMNKIHLLIAHIEMLSINTHLFELLSPKSITENRYIAMNKQNRPVEFQDVRKITDRLRGICRIYPKSSKKKPEDVKCHQLDLGWLGSWPTMPKTLPWAPVHCAKEWNIWRWSKSSMWHPSYISSYSLIIQGATLKAGVNQPVHYTKYDI